MVARIFPLELPARSILIAVAFSTLATLVSGCGGTSDRSGTIAGTITVFAAASLVNSFRDLADAFQDQHPQVQVEYHFAGSQTLSTQLTHGAAADVFAAADARQMAVASNAGLLNGKPVYFAANQMVVVAPIDSQAVVSLTDLAKRDVTVAMGTEQVPAGVYTRQSLELMAGDTDFPSGFADSVLANVVTNETSVRAVAQKVAWARWTPVSFIKPTRQPANFRRCFVLSTSPVILTWQFNTPLLPWQPAVNGESRLTSWNLYWAPKDGRYCCNTVLALRPPQSVRALTLFRA